MIDIYDASYIFFRNSTVLRDYCLIVQNGLILDVIKNDSWELHKYRNDSRYISCKNQALIPSFFDCHCHLELTGLHENKRYHSLYDLMNDSGCYHRDECNDEQARGQRKSLDNGACRIMDWVSRKRLPSIAYESVDSIKLFVEIIDTKELLDIKKLDASLPASYGIAPHSLYMVHPNQFHQMFQTKRELTMHIAETPDESRWLFHGDGKLYEHCTAKGGVAPLRGSYSNYGEALKGIFGCRIPPFIFVHGTYLDAEGLDYMKINHSCLCLCPLSNRRLTGALPDINLLLEKDVTLLLGSDCFEADFDLLSQASMFLEKEHSLQYEIASRLFNAMTINGANAFRLNHIYGTLDIGKRADFNIIDFNPSRQLTDENFSYYVLKEGCLLEHITN